MMDCEAEQEGWSAGILLSTLESEKPVHIKLIVDRIITYRFFVVYLELETTLASSPNLFGIWN